MSSSCQTINKGTFNINNQTRLEQDRCFLDTKTKQSMGTGMYQTYNYYDCECGIANVKEVSLQQPTVNHNDGYGWSQCAIDKDSDIRNAKNQTNPKLIQQLSQKPYLTTPYMGRGIGDVCLETTMLPGESTFQKKSCNSLSGVYISNVFTPQIPFIEENVQNPIHIIPEDNDTKWLRGGQPSRQVIRNLDYLERCGFENKNGAWIRPKK